MKKIIIIMILLFLGGCAQIAPSAVIVQEDLTVQVTNTPKDFNLEMSLDRISGYDALVLSSHNPDVDNSGSREDIWEPGGLMIYLDTAEIMNISSTSTDDTLLGTGLRVLFMRCLNENLTIHEEIINMDGTNTVQSTGECLRPWFIAGVSGGSTGENQGAITVTSASTGNVQMQMDSLEGISKNSQFTVPIGVTATIKKIMIGATKSGGQSPIVEIKGKVRFLNTNIWIQSFDFKLDTTVSDTLTIDQPVSNQLVGGSDFRIEVTSDKDNTDVLARTYAVFTDNNATGESSVPVNFMN